MEQQNKSNATASNDTKHSYSLYELWDRYEKIAMHFNDLILKIRVQALAVVAAISAIVGLLSKSFDSATFSWKIMTFVFFLLFFFWIAIWILDFYYYNRLLMGAVKAILDLEEKSKTADVVTEIQLSTLIEDEVSGKTINNASWYKYGRWWFYILVFIALVIGLIYSLYKGFGADIIKIFHL